MIHRVNESLIRYRGMLWSPAKARKVTTCWLSGQRIEIGEAIWRPITNSNERMRRLKNETVEALA